MGSGREKRDIPEMFDTSSSVKMGKHKTFIKKIIDNGYEIESEDSEEKLGSDGTLVSESHITILMPKNSELPKLKFIATESFGKYDYENEMFEEFEEPRFDLKSYQKSADIRHRDDTWEPIELDG